MSWVTKALASRNTEKRFHQFFSKLSSTLQAAGIGYAGGQTVLTRAMQKHQKIGAAHECTLDVLLDVLLRHINQDVHAVPVAWSIMNISIKASGCHAATVHRQAVKRYLSAAVMHWFASFKPER
ncbi:hypothetical protein AK812_SmicGene43614 [Symbiodinium microadriaticum]|uniref:Uncharacterized protein n=1 Tax=Symbiodinium microadriaticum TaxID=2951 RepID=A0A1Q9C0K0_SYMMI|nr:hypothetical protein AK812_SmicGene43614 [Symbiodinium microadriaticum]